jgi:hypothetical protein
VKKGRNAGYLFCAEIEFWHALIWAAVLNHGRYQFTIVIVHHEFATDQIGAAFAAARIGAMAETAIRTKDLAPAGKDGGVGRRPNWIRRRRGYASRGGARRLGRWTCLIGTGFLDQSGNRRLLCYQGGRAEPQ